MNNDTCLKCRVNAFWIYQGTDESMLILLKKQPDYKALEYPLDVCVVDIRRRYTHRYLSTVKAIHAKSGLGPTDK